MPKEEGAVCAFNGCAEIGLCFEGSCNKQQVPDNFPCDDGNSCTNEDTCQQGECISLEEKEFGILPAQILVQGLQEIDITQFLWSTEIVDLNQKYSAHPKNVLAISELEDGRTRVIWQTEFISVTAHNIEASAESCETLKSQILKNYYLDPENSIDHTISLSEFNKQCVSALFISDIFADESVITKQIALTAGPSSAEIEKLESNFGGENIAVVISGPFGKKMYIAHYAPQIADDYQSEYWTAQEMHYDYHILENSMHTSGSPFDDKTPRIKSLSITQLGDKIAIAGHWQFRDLLNMFPVTTEDDQFGYIVDSPLFLVYYENNEALQENIFTRRDFFLQGFNDANNNSHHGVAFAHLSQKLQVKMRIETINQNPSLVFYGAILDFDSPLHTLFYQKHQLKAYFFKHTLNNLRDPLFDIENFKIKAQLTKYDSDRDEYIFSDNNYDFSYFPEEIATLSYNQELLTARSSSISLNTFLFATEESTLKNRRYIRPEEEQTMFTRLMNRRFSRGRIGADSTISNLKTEGGDFYLLNDIDSLSFKNQSLNSNHLLTFIPFIFETRISRQINRPVSTGMNVFSHLFFRHIPSLLYPTNSRRDIANSISIQRFSCEAEEAQECWAHSDCDLGFACKITGQLSRDNNCGDILCTEADDIYTFNRQGVCEAYEICPTTSNIAGDLANNTPQGSVPYCSIGDTPLWSQENSNWHCRIETCGIEN